MAISTALCASLLCICMFAAMQDSAPVFACNLKAIGAEDRPRYNDLMRRLRASITHREEIANGYIFKLEGKAMGLTDVAEWINLERLCCPFLKFQLSASGSQAEWSLMLSGPPGVKPLIEAEFPIGALKTANEKQ